MIDLKTLVAFAVGNRQRRQVVNLGFLDPLAYTRSGQTVLTRGNKCECLARVLQ